MGTGHTGRKENGRGVESHSKVGSLLLYSSCVHLDPSCRTRAAPALQARLSSHLLSARVAPANAPDSRYWASLCACGHPQVLRRSFVTGGEEQERSHSRGASADHSIFPVRGSPRTVSPTLRWGTPTSSTGRPPVQALSSPYPSMPVTSESPPSTVRTIIALCLPRRKVKSRGPLPRLEKTSTSRPGPPRAYETSCDGRIEDYPPPSSWVLK